MPEIFWFFGFSFFFYSREHEPIHVHVEGHDGLAIFDWDGANFVLRERHNIKASDLKRIVAVIDENKDLIIKYWDNYFNKKDKQ